MILNYARTAARHIWRYRGHSFIKIFGLSLGIASCLLIYLFVADELSYDGFHENGADLYRFVQVQFDKDTGKRRGYIESIPAPVGPELARSLPSILLHT